MEQICQHCSSDSEQEQYDDRYASTSFQFWRRLPPFSRQNPTWAPFPWYEFESLSVFRLCAMLSLATSVDSGQQNNCSFGSVTVLFKERLHYIFLLCIECYQSFELKLACRHCFNSPPKQLFRRTPDLTIDSQQLSNISTVPKLHTEWYCATQWSEMTNGPLGVQASGRLLVQVVLAPPFSKVTEQIRGNAFFPSITLTQNRRMVFLTHAWKISILLFCWRKVIFIFPSSQRLSFCVCWPL